MKEEPSRHDEWLLAPATSKEPASRQTLLLPETFMNMPGESARMPQHDRRGRRPRWLFGALVGVLALAMLAGGIGLLSSLLQRQANPAQTLVSTNFHTTPCPFNPVTSVVEGHDVHCGYLVVPEDHGRPHGPTIRLAVAVFKAAHPAPDPVIYLEGGPGSPVLETLGPLLTTRDIASIWPLDRDLILFDQRGSGSSQPSLACTEVTTMVQATYLQMVHACHDRLVREGVNLHAYTTLQDAADVHDLVHALGYRQVNLDGISYGTRLALTVMRLFPADIRSVVLDSAYPPQINGLTGSPAAAQRAFETLFRQCAASLYCNVNYPHLRAVFAQLVTDLNKQPVTVQGRDPQTGKLVSGLLTGDNLVAHVRQALYQTSLIPKLPALIYQIRTHDYAHISPASAALTSSLDSLGVYYSVECGEDRLVPQTLVASVQVVGPEIRHYFLTRLQQVYAVCQLWGVQPVPPVQREAVSSAIPTLILSGEYDPVTPPTYGVLGARTLSKSYSYLFPGVGHGVHNTNSCANSIINAFQQFPNTPPDASCLKGLGEPFFE